MAPSGLEVQVSSLCHDSELLTSIHLHIIISSGGHATSPRSFKKQVFPQPLELLTSVYFSISRHPLYLYIICLFSLSSIIRLYLSIDRSIYLCIYVSNNQGQAHFHLPYPSSLAMLSYSIVSGSFHKRPRNSFFQKFLQDFPRQIDTEDLDICSETRREKLLSFSSPQPSHYF